MTMFGLDGAVVRRHMIAVAGGTELDDAQVADRFARAAWSVITEPGDGVAGALIAERGPVEALRAVLHDAGREGRTADVDGDLSAALVRWRPRVRSGDVLRALTQAGRAGVRMLVPGGDGGDGVCPWPAGVDDLAQHAPIVLWALGDPSLLADAQAGVALVGARAATGYGEHVATELSAGLVDHGFAVVSGAAYGIDGTAHRAALACGGLTFAFLAGGVDRFYPAGHDDLLRRIAQHGVVLSELPCGAAPTKWRFLQRNRLIAACSAATVVVEAGARSGSLNTAGHASTLGRPLGAVPGPVTSPASAGCHRLLREYDAVCVTNAAEVVELVQPSAAGDELVVAERRRDGQGVVRTLDALSTRTAHTAVEVAARSGLGLPAVLSALGTLDVEGRAREVAGGWLAVPQRR